MQKWIYDSKKWQDVFTCKPYEYLSLVSQMKTPWFDNVNKVWVDKNEYDGVNKSAIASADAEIMAAKAAVASVATNEKQTFINSITVQDDDMPF